MRAHREFVKGHLRLALVVTAAMTAMVFASTASAQTSLSASLNGAQEVPTVRTLGTGTLSGVINAAGTSLTVTVTATGLNAPAAIVGGHIHAGAVGSNGGVVCDLKMTASPTTATCNAANMKIVGSVTTFAAFVAAIKAGGTYANVHTALHGGGEIRGQIRAAAIKVSLLDLTATRTHQGVDISWTTASELGCGSFRILRADGTGAAKDDHSALDRVPPVRCQDSPSGASYRVVDPTAQPGAAYSYVLSEQESAGGVNRYGPVALGAHDATASYVPAIADRGAAPAINTGCSTSGFAGGCCGWLAVGAALGLVVLFRRRRR